MRMWHILVQTCFNQHPSCIIEVQILLNTIPYFQAWSSFNSRFFRVSAFGVGQARHFWRWSSFSQEKKKWCFLKTLVCLSGFQVRHVSALCITEWLLINYNLATWYYCACSNATAEPLQQVFLEIRIKCFPCRQGNPSKVLGPNYNRISYKYIIATRVSSLSPSRFEIVPELVSQTEKRHASASNKYQTDPTRECEIEN